MAKKKRADANGPASGQVKPPNQGETVSGYFRKVFAENPSWIDSRSNDQLLLRWLQDHPGETKVPEKVRQNLSNIKSVLRKQSRKKPKPKKVAQANPAETHRKVVRGLGTLEEQIDECLTLAKIMDREGLANVISLLRRARNEVVWKMGETADR
jgi:hypothetical protein